MILKKIIIFVTIFYSLNADIIYQHVDKTFKGIQYHEDLSVFHDNVDLFLQDQYHTYWKDRANGKGAYLIHQFSSSNNEVKCVDSQTYYLSKISELDLRSLQDITLNKSKIIYDLDIEFKEENQDYKIEHQSESDKMRVNILVTQILKFHIPNIIATQLVRARTKIELSCFDVVDDEDFTKFNVETSLKSAFGEKDGATGGFDNKAMSDDEFQPRFESEENQKKKKSYQHKKEINEESESEESESEESESEESKSKESKSKEDEIYSTSSKLDRDKERKKLSKKKDNPIVKRFRAIGFMKRKDKRVKVKEEGASFISSREELDKEKQIKDDEKYAKALEKEQMEMLRSRGKRERERERELERERAREQEQERGEQNYSSESEDELYVDIQSLKNQVQSL